MQNQKDGMARFDEVYHANKDKVFKTALHYSNNNYHVAQEITQSVFLKLFVHSDKLNSAHLEGWLKTLAKNAALNHVKKSGREIPDENIALTSDLKAMNEDMEDEVLMKMLDKERTYFKNSILQELYELNERWHTAVILTYCMDKPQKDVAKEMGISLEVLQGVLYRARSWIKEKYGEKYRTTK